ncbi:MAG: hypothetical protein K2Q26_16290 [Bdellovibrionales bacterium]|nr:hypothetical protein [Bdellovibrionales bacterium]
MQFWIIYASLICAVYMCAIIWIIQAIHYPVFSMIDTKRFPEFCGKHTSAMGLLVGPVMILELGTAVALVLIHVDYFSITNLIMNAGLWLLTFLVSVPWHNRLAAGYDAYCIERLVRTNWPRTILWTVKAVLMIYWFAQVSR